MRNLKKYIESGIVENYVLGITLPEETLEIEEMSIKHQEVRAAISKFCLLFEENVFANAIAPPSIIKPELMATIDYMERLENGEALTFPPLLNENSQIDDFSDWLNRADMKPLAGFNDIEVKLIGYTPTCTTAIVWVKQIAPEEVHKHEFERFLIVEGTCTIHISSKTYDLVPGNYLQIPLFETHHVVVTSTMPCKVILQRVAA
ncbi:MAG: cupin domain-containing protein [Chitinophagaceae bacterium]|nr:cupin domain-containing protein [Chitinophagaceae bacterium]